MAYAETKGRTCECAVLRAVRMGNQQRCPDEGSVQRPHGMNPEAGFWYSLLPGESRGIKDYSDFTQDQWYKSTAEEIDYGHVPQGGSLHQVLTDDGDNVIKALVSPATITDAYLRDWQSYDSGVLADIWVRTSPSEPPTVTATGSPSVTNGDGYTKYTFSGGSKGKAALKTIDYNQYADQGNLQGCDAAFSYVQITLPTAVSKPKNPTHPNNWQNLRYQEKSGSAWVTRGPVPSTWYDCSTWENCYREAGVSRSYIAKGAYVSGGASGSGGSVTVGNYTPEVVSRKVLQPAILTPEKTRDRKWAYYTRVPGSAAEQTKTFLTQGGSTAIQNFAFDMEEE